MSRTQWRSLVAVLAVVLGLLCVPAAAAAGPVTAEVVAAAGDTGIPGCDRTRDHDGSGPALPARPHAAHDQAPGPAVGGPPAATGRGHAAERVAVRGPGPATPTPVELSVLRV
ncbi:hypothetical protein [Streptomyces sp. B1I3]|uniref:hypothetical protein n=1 Tax=Streptomyces sp. B1I3 TaxID=3042264 RepID=UPI002780811F|nr:hypothetical protein [Streptomyces sp. B1I3]MDQ0794992.1 hypothetical protein [Streptomyces sp. B1I3]